LDQGKNSLDVFLRGERDYVQGTQIIARVSEVLTPQPHIFRQAEFHRKTVNLVACKPDGTAGISDDLGRVYFQSGSNPELKSFALSELSAIAPRVDLPISVLIVRRSGPVFGPDSGNADAPDCTVWDWSGVSDFEDMLNAIVQIIRAEHSVRWPECSDIWLTGFRRCNLPVAKPACDEGSFELFLGRRLAGSRVGSFQTIWKFNLPDLGLSGTSTFTFMLKEG
jgi:hypothetical protein